MSKLKTDPAGYVIDHLKRKKADLPQVKGCSGLGLIFGGGALAMTWSMNANYTPLGALMCCVFTAVGMHRESSIQDDYTDIDRLIAILETIPANKAESNQNTQRAVKAYLKVITNRTCSGRDELDLKGILSTLSIANEDTTETTAELVAMPIGSQRNSPLTNLSILSGEPKPSAPPMATAVYTPLAIGRF